MPEKKLSDWIASEIEWKEAHPAATVQLNGLREMQRRAAALESLVEEIREALRGMAELREEKARLDWLMDNMMISKNASDKASTVYISRESIDAARAEGERMPEWKPIETAPKDGTPILLWGKDFRTPIWGYWSDDARDIDDRQPGWIDGSRNKYEEYYSFAGITHWLPLPEAPHA